MADDAVEPGVDERKTSTRVRANSFHPSAGTAERGGRLRKRIRFQIQPNQVGVRTLPTDLDERCAPPATKIEDPRELSAGTSRARYS